MTEAVPARSEVSFEDSNGKQRGLRFDFNALVEVEEKLGGKPFGQVAASLAAGMISFSEVRVIFLVGLNCYADEHDNKKLKVTLPKVGQIVQGIGVKQSVRYLTEAIQVAFPDMDDDADEDEEDSEGKQ